MRKNSFLLMVFDLFQKSIREVIRLRSEESDKLISLIGIEKLQKLLVVLLDEEEFLSPYGIRSVSKKHTRSYKIEIDKQLYSLQYDPGESTIRVFGSNSNWRGPIWFPINYLI